MSDNQESESLWLQYVICYVSLIAMAGLSIWLIQGLSLALSHIGLLLGFSRYAMTVLNQFGFILMGVLWLIALFWIEHFLRIGIKRNRLWPRIGKVFAGEMGLFALAYLIQALPV